MRARLARRIARRYGVEVMVRATSAVRAFVVPDAAPYAVAVLRRADTLAMFRDSVRGARAMLDALPRGPR